jgi:hypothetical protein
MDAGRLVKGVETRLNFIYGTLSMRAHPKAGSKLSFTGLQYWNLFFVALSTTCASYVFLGLIFCYLSSGCCNNE